MKFMDSGTENSQQPVDNIPLPNQPEGKITHQVRKQWETDRSYVLVCAGCGDYWPCNQAPEKQVEQAEETRMCPCGNCKATWEQAVADLMHGPAKLNRDQAETRLNQMLPSTSRP